MDRPVAPKDSDAVLVQPFNPVFYRLRSPALQMHQATNVGAGNDISATLLQVFEFVVT